MLIDDRRPDAGRHEDELFRPSKPANKFRKEIIRIDLKGTGSKSRGSGIEPVPGKTHYFRGSDPKGWLTDIPSFSKVRYKDVYPGIDAFYYGNPQQLEYDFLVSPGADPRQIRFTVQGGKTSVIDDSGALVIRLKSGGEVRLPKPKASQQGQDGRQFDVPIRFQRLSGNDYGFKVGRYRKDKVLLIDPYVVYSNAFGGSYADEGLAIAVDAYGYVYVTGYTMSDDYPAGSIHAPAGSIIDVFVTKLSPRGSSFVYSAVIGGVSYDLVTGIRVDREGCAYLAGGTHSPDFPVTPGALQPTHRGIENGFLFKLSPGGDALVWSTFVGGSYSDAITGMSLNEQGLLYLAGGTRSSDFPVVDSTPGIAPRGPRSQRGRRLGLGLQSGRLGKGTGVRFGRSSCHSRVGLRRDRVGDTPKLRRRRKLVPD